MPWRKKALQKPGGAYWMLERGSRTDVERITLGYAREPEAEAARALLDECERRPWSGHTEAGEVLQTRWTMADYLVYLWKHGSPPFPGAALQVDGEQPSSSDAERTAAARGNVLRFLANADWRFVATLAQRAEATPPRLMTIAAYFEAFHKPWRMAERPAGWAAEASHWRRILRIRSDGGLGDVALGDLDAHAVADYLDALTVERPRVNEGVKVGDAVAGATKRLHRSALQAMVKRAFRLRHLDALPPLATFQIEGSTQRVRAQTDPLDLDEVARLLDAAPSPMHRGLFGLGCGEGLRPSEIIRARWEDVDLVAATITIRTGGSRRKRGFDQDVTIPLTPLAHAELARWWNARGQPAEGLAFPRPQSRPGNLTGDAYASSSGFHGALQSAATRAGIDRRITPYLMRHTTATICWGLGIDRDTCRRILRHADEAMLDAVYSRPRPADIAKRLTAFTLAVVA